MHEQVDVVIVGAGIAGSALAKGLTEAGHEVLVLERQRSYRDKVRGEVINCWGVVEARELGLEKILLDAGGGWAEKFVGFDETVAPEVAEANALALDDQLPGVPGVLDVGHPEACAAIASAAGAAGAEVLMGVQSVQVTPGETPTVTYALNGTKHVVRARLVVGADGRLSTTRRQAGISLTQTPPNSLGGGLLVDDLHRWPADTTSIGTEGDILYFVFPRPGGRARLYILHDSSEKGRFAGPDRNERFLDAFQLECIPGSDMFASATPATSAAFYPMNDAWTDRLVRDNVVLIGDAAGWTDPIIGQGLCMALRDARSVRDALVSNRIWSEAIFADYEAEHSTRRRRLTIAGSVRTLMGMTFTPEGARRRRAYAKAWPKDPVLAGTRLSIYRGPDGVPGESFEPSTIRAIQNL